MANSTPAAYKLVILAAGSGVRLRPLTTSLNKALLPVGDRAALTRVLDRVSPTVPVIVALGFEGAQIQEYLQIAHPDRSFTFVNVDHFTGEGSGPGYSLLACKEHLQCPFVVSTVDTLVDEVVPPPDRNWIGIAPVSDTSQFNSVNIRGGFVVDMKDKEQSLNTHAFIGLAGICDFPVFWHALEQNHSLVSGELQLSNGLRDLIPHQLCGIPFTWHDTGTLASYRETASHFSSGAFDFSKANEYIYFVGDRVIKYFEDSEIARLRVERAQRLHGFVPTIVAAGNHFYAYRKVSGSTLYSVLTASLAQEFYDWLADVFWHDSLHDALDDAAFRDACHSFYRDKTLSRVAAYFDKYSRDDASLVVNRERIPAIHDLLDRIDWDVLIEHSLPSRFHGDLQFDNILFVGGEQRFVLLDWRQDFAGQVVFGDRYYDLAKLYGGTVIPYNRIKKNDFVYREDSDGVYVDISSSYELQRAQAALENFIQARGYNLNHVRLLTSLIFLNMAPLHTEPFDHALRALGALQLHSALEHSVSSHALSRHETLHFNR